METYRLEAKHDLLQLLKVRCTVTCGRVPTRSTVPCSARNNTTANDRSAGLAINTVAANGLTTSDIVQTLVPQKVDERIQESESGLSGRKTGIIQQRNDTSKDGRGSRGTSTGLEFAATNNLVIRKQTVGSNVRETTPLEVGVLGVVFNGGLVQKTEVVPNCFFLVPSTGEVSAEPTGAGSPSDFRSDRLGTSHCCKERASSGENGIELSLVRAVVAAASCTNTKVTARFQDRDTSQASQTNQIACTDSILVGNGLLVISVRVGDNLGQIGVLLRQKVFVIRNVWLVLIGGGIEARNEWAVLKLAMAL